MNTLDTLVGLSLASYLINNGSSNKKKSLLGRDFCYKWSLQQREVHAVNLP